eukprot:5693016-Pleurochrysis_carterae.AAC.1
MHGSIRAESQRFNARGSAEKSACAHTRAGVGAQSRVRASESREGACRTVRASGRRTRLRRECASGREHACGAHARERGCWDIRT